jgi:ribosomal protein L7/L12
MHEQEDEKFDEVIFDGIRFLESLTRYYGAERGMEVWEKLGEVVGKDVQGQVFLAILTGESSNRVRVSRGTCTEAVAAIKAIRLATNMGLKEAKDTWDLTLIKTVTLDNVQRDVKKEFIRDLRNIGMRVH